MKRKEQDCVDCGIDTYESIGDYYMVNHDIWNKYGLGGSVDLPDGGWTSTNNSGMLCRKCLETRMGRKLRKSDMYNNWPL